MNLHSSRLFRLRTKVSTIIKPKSNLLLRHVTLIASNVSTPESFSEDLSLFLPKLNHSFPFTRGDLTLQDYTANQDLSTFSLKSTKDFFPYFCQLRRVLTFCLHVPRLFDISSGLQLSRYLPRLLHEVHTRHGPGHY